MCSQRSLTMHEPTVSRVPWHQQRSTYLADWCPSVRLGFWLFSRRGETLSVKTDSQAMSRRFQFSLRAMLVVSVAICVAMGSWRLHHDRRQYVHASPVPVNWQIDVTGQFFHLNGPEIHQFVVVAEAPEKDGKRFRWGSTGIARRKGAGTYEITTRLRPAEAPGIYKLMLWPMEPERPCITSKVAIVP